MVGQNKYKIEYKGTRNSDCLNGNNYVIALDEFGISTSGNSSNSVLFNTENILTVFNNSSVGTSYDEDYVVSTSREYYYVRKYSDGTNGACTNQDFSNPYYLSQLECTSIPFSLQWRGVDWERRIAYKIGSLTNYNGNNASLTLLECEPLNIDFAPCASSFAVEYQIGAGAWTQLLPYAFRSASSSISFASIPELQANQVFRVRARYSNSGSPQVSGFLTINTLDCAPRIISQSVQAPLCSYDNGSITFTMNRPLNLANFERLANISYVKIDDMGLEVVFNPDPNNAIYTGNQFTFPETLSPGRYRFKYQSEYRFQDPDDTSDNVLTAYTESAVIEIIAPPPLAYKVEIASEMSCFDTADGEVKITINPDNNGSIGSDSYYYTLGNDTTEYTFTTPTTIVGNLGTSSIAIKVFDSNDCTQKIN